MIKIIKQSLSLSLGQTGLLIMSSAIAFYGCGFMSYLYPIYMRDPRYETMIVELWVIMGATALLIILRAFRGFKSSFWIWTTITVLLIAYGSHYGYQEGDWQVFLKENEYMLYAE